MIIERGLGQCPAPTTCPAGQTLSTMLPAAVQSASGTAMVTDGSCPQYQCWPIMTASPQVCTTAQCQADMAALNLAPVQTPTATTSTPFMIALILGAGLLLLLMMSGRH
jgi:hypothetical protein